MSDAGYGSDKQIDPDRSPSCTSYGTTLSLHELIRVKVLELTPSLADSGKFALQLRCSVESLHGDGQSSQR